MASPPRALALLFVVACSPKPADPLAAVRARARGANLLLITLDTTRADHLGCYGSKVARTPTLDRLAREGVLFERALAAAPITLPSHASLLSGLDPIAHGARDNGLFTVGPETTLLSELLQDAGRATAAFVSAMPLSAHGGLTQGFDLYDEPSAADHGGLERSADATVDAVLAWLARKPPAPWFAWVHFFDAHSPYTPPADLAPLFANPYDGEIAHVDRQLARLLAALGEATLARTAIIVAADHGEGLGDHGENEHGIFLYDSTLRVPLIARMPGVFASGRRVGGQVGLVDVVPTLCDLFGLKPPDGLAGSSLLACIADDPARGAAPEATLDPAPWHDVHLESLLPWYDHGCAPLEGVSTREWKLVSAPQPELYAWPTDPAERHDQFAAQPRAAAQLQARMIELRHGRDPAPPAANSSLTDEERERLQALGYAGASEPAAGSALEGALDPKQALALLQARREATAALRRGDAEAAERTLRQTVQRAPRDASSLGLLGHLLATRGQLEEGIEILRRCVTLRPDYLGAELDLARALDRHGNPEGALEVLELALRTAPGLQAAYVEAVRICLSTNDPERARRYVDRARRNVRDEVWLRKLAASL